MYSSDFLDEIFSNPVDKPALVLWHKRREEKMFTYSSLKTLVDSLAGKIARWFEKQEGSLYPKGNNTLLVISENCPDLIALFLACIKISAQYTPLNPLISSGELKKVLDGLVLPVVIIDESVDTKRLNLLLARGLRVIRFHSKGKESYREVLRICRGHKLLPQNIRLNSKSNAVLLINSSGTGGDSKKLIFSKERVNIFLQQQRILFEQFPDSRVNSYPVFESELINILPLYHLGGLSFCLQGLMMGRTVNFLNSTKGEDYLDLAEKVRLNFTLMVPSMYRLLLENENEQLKLKGRNIAFKYCLTMGEAISEELSNKIKAAFNAEVISAYGLSECLSGLGHSGSENEVSTPAGSCGKHLFGEIKLLDKVGNESSWEGELWVKNSTVFPCYDNQALNKQRFVDGWFNTGDYFSRDEEGFYYYLARNDEMLVINGKNTYPSQIEALIGTYPEIESSVAVPLHTRNTGIRIGVLLKTRNNITLDYNILIDYCLENGSLHCVPVWFVGVAAIPLNGTGKLDREKCLQLVQNNYDVRHSAQTG